jgi:hypothetical protein
MLNALEDGLIVCVPGTGTLCCTWYILTCVYLVQKPLVVPGTTPTRHTIFIPCQSPKSEHSNLPTRSSFAFCRIVLE